MKTALLDYDLPEELIAQRPSVRRDGARLLVLGRGGLEHRRIAEWPDLVPEGALVVVNDSRVLRARLLGRRRDTSGGVEIFLLRRLSDRGSSERWACLGRANRPLLAGAVIVAGEIEVHVLSRTESVLEVELRVAHGAVASEVLESVGAVPLPPYIRRESEDIDRERYQTIYARVEGSVAAPTAGLHLTQSALARLEERGVSVGRVTLHVGLGTFRPVTAVDLDQHSMHAEELVVPAELVENVAAARRRGAPVVAVGTTVVRALESARDPSYPGHVRPAKGSTSLLIQPGYSFGVVDALLTNFHMPRSTLLALVSAFTGLDRIREAYAAAVAARYRFLSYGDAMWLPERGR